MTFINKPIIIFPGYIPPEKEELFSSWLFRLAREHCIPLYSFTKYYLDNSSIWNRDLDKWLPNAIIQKIASLTPMTPRMIKQLQLGSYEGIIFNEKIKSHYTEGLTNIGIFHRQRTLKGLLVCPNCLKQKGYVLKSWRLLSSLVCLECKTYLIDCCPTCDYPIAFHRLEITRKNRLNDLPIYICYNCHSDLSRSAKSCANHSLIKQYQNYINTTISNGWNDKTKYSFYYFKVLFLIMKQALSTSELWFRVRVGFEENYGLNLNGEKQKKLYYTLTERKLILPLIFHLLQDWPNRFIKFCKNHNIRYSDFSRAYTPIPYWFYSILKTL